MTRPNRRRVLPGTTAVPREGLVRSRSAVRGAIPKNQCCGRDKGRESMIELGFHTDNWRPLSMSFETAVEKGVALGLKQLSSP